MSSRRPYQAGFQQGPEPTDYSHHQRRCEPFGDYEYEDPEISLMPAFEGLDLNRTHENRHGQYQYPRVPSSGSHSGSPLRPQHDAGRYGDRSPAWHHMQAAELDPGIAMHSPFGLSPTTSPPRDVELYRRPPPTEEPEDFLAYGAHSPRHSRYNRSPAWQTSPQGSARIPGRGPWGYHPYPEDEFVVCSGRVPEGPMLCRCRTCVGHRRGIREQAMYSSYGHAMPPIPHHRRRFYPNPSSRRYPTRSEIRHPDEEYYSDSLDYDSDGSSYDSRVEAVRPVRAFVDSPWPNRRIVGGRGPWNRFDPDYDGFGSDHEYSDSASYTGYERYDDYGYSD